MSEEEFNELILEEYNNHHHLFEALTSRNPILKKIDSDFAHIKKNQSNVTAVRLLTKHISQFTRIPNINIKIKKKSWTYSVFPIYSRSIPMPFKDRTKKFDIHEYVDKVYLVMGGNVIDALTQKELTALVLHELGHVEEHSSLLTAVFTSAIGKFADKLTTLGFVLPVIGLPFLAVGAATSHVARFFDRIEEYKSDNFAVANGYGEEMARVLYKMKKIDDKMRLKRKTRKVGRFKRLRKVLMNLFYPKEHPSDKKRVCSLINNMLDDYKKQYPELKQDMHIMFSDLKCK